MRSSLEFCGEQFLQLLIARPLLCRHRGHALRQHGQEASCVLVLIWSEQFFGVSFCHGEEGGPAMSGVVPCIETLVIVIVLVVTIGLLSGEHAQSLVLAVIDALQCMRDEGLCCCKSGIQSTQLRSHQPISRFYLLRLLPQGLVVLIQPVTLRQDLVIRGIHLLRSILLHLQPVLQHRFALRHLRLTFLLLPQNTSLKHGGLLVDVLGGQRRIAQH
mmetsp:Transcript_34732/g.92737  ORF Transcript_34732/g.92737 Transcript_34732/m.92737 type:complete len:216 (+) Transcript_34732:300-947(+)